MASSSLMNAFNAAESPSSSPDRLSTPKPVRSYEHLEAKDDVESVIHQLHMLNQKRAQLEAQLVAHRSASILRRFPIELLTEIFVWCCGSSGNTMSTKEGPWQIGQVCSMWRQIVRSTPSLWTYISIRNPPNNRKHFHALTQALSMSGQQSLSVRVELEYHSQHTRYWLEPLMKTSDRWLDVSFDCPLDTLVTLEGLRGHLGSLHSLRLALCDCYAGLIEIDLEDEDFRAFVEAPQLRKVELEQALCTISLPLDQLTDFRQSWVDTHNDIEFMGHSFDRLPGLVDCRRLTRLDLITEPKIRQQDESSPSMAIVHLESLQSLHVTDCQVLSRLDTPRLEALFIEAIYSPATEPGWNVLLALAPIRDFLLRSQCSLQTLRVLDVQDVDELRAVLTLTPELLTLEVAFEHWLFRNVRYAVTDFRTFQVAMNGVFKLLRGSATSGSDVLAIVPRLQSLLVSIDNVAMDYEDGSVEIDHVALADLIVNRQVVIEGRAEGKIEEPLTKIEVDIRLSSLPRMFSLGSPDNDLQVLKDNGFDVAIFTSPSAIKFLTSQAIPMLDEHKVVIERNRRLPTIVYV